MPDIRDVLERAAPPVSEVDLEGVGRRARRRRAVPRVVAASVAAAALVVAVVVVTQDSGPGHITSGTTPDTTTSTGEAPTTSTAPTTTTVAPTTTAPPPTVPVGEDRLSSESRLGYAGLGPIKHGMNFDYADAAARVRKGEPTGCDIFLYAEEGSGVEAVSVWRTVDGRVDDIGVHRPGIRTISGIEVGNTRTDVLRTYPAAYEYRSFVNTDGPSQLVITGPEGQVILFSFDAADVVTSMTLSSDLQAWEGRRLC
jgi:hypothetical protein